MSINDLAFSVLGTTVYDPVTVTGSYVVISVTNYGDTALEDIGLYISPATEVGDVDFPADYPPETDYEDLLTWGTRTALGLVAEGGLYVSLPTNSGTFTGYVTRSAGAQYKNRIAFKDLAAGETAEFSIKFETPVGESARRFFVDIKLE
jgi:hypothetical protein